MTKADSATRRRILARKAALASIAGLAAACAHEPQTVTVEPVAAASASSSPSPSATATAARPPPPPPDDDDLVVRHPMHGSDPVGPPIVRPTPPPWSTLLGKLSVSSKAKLSAGHRIVEVTIVLADPLRMNAQPIELNVTGGRIVKPTALSDGQTSQSVVISLEPSPGVDPVEITLGVVDRAGQRVGHARFEVTGARSAPVGQAAPAKVVRLEN